MLPDGFDGEQSIKTLCLWCDSGLELLWGNLEIAINTGFNYNALPSASLTSYT
jgi:hypothetical protein